MVRFCGMMPSSDIERQEIFKDMSDLEIIIQAGVNGWTIIYADGSTNYADKLDTVDNNFNEALAVAESCLGKLIHIESEPWSDFLEEEQI